MNATHNLSVGVPLTYNHAIARGYRHHMNGSGYRVPYDIVVPPQGKTEWLDVGGWMDTLQHGSWQVLCSALGPPAPPPANATECKINVASGCPIDPANKTVCTGCAERLMDMSCPVGCMSKGVCDSKFALAACALPPAPPTTQQLKCYAVAAKSCAQNRSGGQAHASNYTMCLDCMKALCVRNSFLPFAFRCVSTVPTACRSFCDRRSPCPAACMMASKPGRCQRAWFERGCHKMAPPAPPPKPRPTKPGCGVGFAGHGWTEPCAPIVGIGHCQIEVGVRERPFATTLGGDGVPVFDGNIVPVAGRSLFDSLTTGTEMLFDASTRATRRMRHNQDDFEEIVAQLKAQVLIYTDLAARSPLYYTVLNRVE